LPCIAAKGLTFKVKGKVIVEDVSAELCGGLNVVLGPNGAGKTTLVEALRRRPQAHARFCAH